MVDINLSKDEDSVTSLAVASSTSSSATAFAGINSSEKDQAADRNEHLRSFRLDYPPKRKVDGAEASNEAKQEYKGQTTPLGRASLFTPSKAPKKETYQRITRLSRPCKVNGGQLGAIATGLASEGEIVLFDAKTNGPMGPWVEARLPLGKDLEAADIDIVELSEAEDVPPGTFSIAYCTDYEVHVCRMTLKQKSAPEPQFVYSEPFPDTFSSSNARPKFRSLRFITPQLLLLSQNRPRRSGADLLLIELSPSQRGRVITRKRLHSTINASTALSVTHLAPLTPTKSTQHVIAVAGQDCSISIFTLEHPYTSPFKSLRLRLHTLLRSVHPLQITSLSFSTFLPPQTAQSKTPPQYIKLASTSMANTVIVHTIPLMPYPPPSEKSPKQRYVLKNPGRGEMAQLGLSVLMTALVIGLGAFLLQALTEMKGLRPETLGAKQIQDYIALPHWLGDSTNSVSIAIGSISQDASAASSNIHNRATDSFSELSKTITSSSNAAKETFPDTPENAKEAVSAALDAASAAASELREASESYSDTASQTISSVASAATSQASSRYHHIRDLLSRHHLHRRHESAEKSSIPHMIIQNNEEEEGEGGLKAGFRHVGKEGAEDAKKFEELSEKEKEIWKEKLKKAGVWTAAEGEAILKGVLFGSVGTVIGQVVGRAVA